MQYLNPDASYGKLANHREVSKLELSLWLSCVCQKGVSPFSVDFASGPAHNLPHCNVCGEWGPAQGYLMSLNMEIQEENNRKR